MVLSSSARIRVIGCLAVLAVMGAAGCDDSPTSPTADANLVVRLTDDHTDDVEQVNIFSSVTANPVGGPPTTLALALMENPQDLLVLQEAVIPLATRLVEAGDYDSLRINLDENRSSIVADGKTIRLRIPSEEIKIPGGFRVNVDGTTTVTLDFDAEASLIRL